MHAFIQYDAMQFNAIIKSDDERYLRIQTCIFFVQEFIEQTVKIRVCDDASHVSFNEAISERASVDYESIRIVLCISHRRNLLDTKF